jgi:phosphoribosylformylglycinamidine cyclo-ligase
MGAIGKLDQSEMHNVFNMGVGMVVAVSAADADKTIQSLRSFGETAYIIGDIINNVDGGLVYV